MGNERVETDTIQDGPGGYLYYTIPKKITMRLLTVAGLLVGFTPIFAPVHEMGHIIVGMLDPDLEITELEWRRTHYRGHPGPVFWVAGYWTMLLVTVAASRIFARKHNVRTAAFVLGLAFCQPIFAVLSSDYQQLPGDSAWFHVPFFVGMSAVMVSRTNDIVRHERRRLRRLRRPM